MARFRPAAALLVAAGLLLGSWLPRPASAQTPDSVAAPVLPQSSLTTAPDTSVDTDVPFVRSPRAVVVRMLELAHVGADDVVYDLGSGDGRIPITAAQQFGARGVGIEIRPDLVEKARRRAKMTGVADRVSFKQGDLFKADFGEASVVTLYLLPDVNTRLRPRLFEQLEPGTRVVSHGFDMDAWEPDTTVQAGDSYLYLWTIPEDVPPHLKE